MNILDQIIKDKYVEVKLRQNLIPITQLEQSVLFDRQPISLARNLFKSRTGIIAEHKRRSPSNQLLTMV